MRHYTSRRERGTRVFAVKHIKTLTFLAALGFFDFITCYVARQYILQTGFWDPVIACESPIQDLGEMLPKSTAICRYVIHNRGRSTLKIDRVRIGCSSACKQMKGSITNSGQGNRQQSKWSLWRLKFQVRLSVRFRSFQMIHSFQACC